MGVWYWVVSQDRVVAGFKWHLSLEHCFVISDKWQDAEAARTAGCAGSAACGG